MFFRPDRRKRRPNVIKLIWLLIGAVGGVIHVLEVSKIYFAYSVGYVVFINTPITVRRPSLNLCFDLLDVYDWLSPLTQNAAVEFIVSEYGKNTVTVEQFYRNETVRSSLLASLQWVVRNDEVRRKMLISRLIENLSAREIFERSGLKNQLVEYGHEVSPENHTFHDVLFGKGYTETWYIRNARICCRIDSTEPSDVYSTTKLNQLSSQASWFSYRFNETVVQMVEAGTVQYSFIPRFHLLRTGLNQIVKTMSLRARPVFSFIIYHVVRLRAPYKTECIDYEETDAAIHTRFDCYELCLKNQSISRWKKILPRISVPLDCNYKIFTQFELDQSEKLRRGRDQLRSTCNDLCRKRECVSTTLVAVIMSLIDGSFMSRDRTNTQIVTVENPDAPVTQTEAFAQIDFAEYASYVTGALSFWVGLVSLHCLQNVYKYIFSYLSPRPSKSPCQTENVSSNLNQ